MGVQFEGLEHIDDFLQPLGERVELAEYVHLGKLELLLVLHLLEFLLKTMGRKGLVQYTSNDSLSKQNIIETGTFPSVVFQFQNCCKCIYSLVSIRQHVINFEK